jgi:hypothetical protein
VTAYLYRVLRSTEHEPEPRGFASAEPLVKGMTIRIGSDGWLVSEVQPREPGRLYDADVLLTPVGNRD